MSRFLSIRRSLSPFFATPAILSRNPRLCSEAFKFRGIEEENEPRSPAISDKFDPFPSRNRGIKLPPLIPSGIDRLERFSIELVDPDLWRVSFGVAQAHNGWDEMPEEPSGETCDGPEELPEFEDIEDLRLHKKLFFKLDKGSKEFEECDINFHRTKSWKKAREKLQAKQKDTKKPQKPNPKSSTKGATFVKQKAEALFRGTERSRIDGGGMGWETPSVECKKARVPTFNQLTDPYHLPFCLDIFVTKGSVRACIVHRATSKVVAVAHSISKDMKFDLTSRKDSTACAAVGKVLAQRAIEDDIHNVVYTPRKGDKIEGKLQIVLQSVIDHGIDVKVKLKQKRPLKENKLEASSRRLHAKAICSPVAFYSRV